jgi:hypothetical protein
MTASIALLRDWLMPPMSREIANSDVSWTSWTAFIAGRETTLLQISLQGFPVAIGAIG